MTDQDQTPPTFLGNLFGWYSMTLLALGMRSGLLDALLEAPGSADEVATRANVDRRNAYEWLRGLTAGGHASHQDGVFTISPETAFLLGPDFPVDVRSVLALSFEAPLVFDDVVAAIRSGDGLPPEVFSGLGAAASGINTPTYAAALVTEWIDGAAAMGERLSSGGVVGELGGGNGDAATMVAKAFPAASVISYDVAETARDDLPDNLRLSVADARDLPDDGPFDLMYCLDAFHHLGDPLTVLHQVRKVLAADGVLMIAEAAMTGDLDQDVADPFSVVAYGAGLMYCLQENLHSGGGAHTSGDGLRWIEEALGDAGFGSIRVTPSDTGYAIITATPEDQERG